jgi:hypothetical protein
MKNTITWLYLEDSSEKGVYPQVKGHSSSRNFQIIYRRCQVTFFNSMVSANDETNHFLYTNKSETELFKTSREKDNT